MASIFVSNKVREKIMKTRGELQAKNPHTNISMNTALEYLLGMRKNPKK